MPPHQGSRLGTKIDFLAPKVQGRGTPSQTAFPKVFLAFFFSKVEPLAEVLPELQSLEFLQSLRGCELAKRIRDSWPASIPVVAKAAAGPRKQDLLGWNNRSLLAHKSRYVNQGLAWTEIGGGGVRPGRSLEGTGWSDPDQGVSSGRRSKSGP